MIVKKNWHNKLSNALQESRITPKESTRQSLYLMVYGKKSMLHMNLEINALIVVYEIGK